MKGLWVYPAHFSSVSVPWPHLTYSLAFTCRVWQWAFFPWVLFGVGSLPPLVPQARLFAECLLYAILCARSWDPDLNEGRFLPYGAPSWVEEIPMAITLSVNTNGRDPRSFLIPFPAIREGPPCNLIVLCFLKIVGFSFVINIMCSL